MSDALKALARDAVLAALAAALFFLWVSYFFTAWDGHAVSVRSSQDATPSAYQVLIVDDERNLWEIDWPAKVVEGRGLPINDRAVPPVDIPDTAPATRKSRFQLVFYVQNAEDKNDVVPTTSARGLGLSVIVWFLLLAFRNMLTSGNPLDYEPRERILPEGQTSSGQVAPPSRKKVSRKTRPERRRGKRG